MSNSVDNSPLNSPTATATATAAEAATATPTSAASPPPPTTTFWCHVCDSSIALLASSPPLTCPRCRTDNLEQMESSRHHHHHLRPSRHPTTFLHPFEDFDNDDDDFDVNYFLFHHPLPPALLSSSSSPDDDDYEVGDPDLDDDNDDGDEVDRDGRPSPAPKASIDAIPDVEITADFLGSDDDSCVLCAVCKDEFAVGSEAKRLPCAHVYHGDCIVPWLSQSNSCPVCRSRLPVAVGEDGRRERRGGGRRAVPVVRFGNLLEEEGGLDALVRVAAGSNRMWFPMLSEEVEFAQGEVAVGAASGRETVSSRWVMETTGGVGIGDRVRG